MSQDLSDLTTWASGLLAQLNASSRKALATRIAADLRTANQTRIAAQTAPDGTAYAPRKPQLRSQLQGRGVRKGLMFKKLRLAKYLKARSTSTAAVVEFAGAVQRIAQVHHHGLRDRVNKGKGPEVQYAARPLIGISEQDTQRITDLILDHLAKA
jgi:phage virion morphogenesis protein